MSFLDETIIPGHYGKVFGTDARQEKDLIKIKKAIEKIPGVEDVILNMDVFPLEFTVHTSAMVKIDAIANEVNRIGFHAIPKALFAL